jgi:tRNA(fMet)-specific endonuclease VapC
MILLDTDSLTLVEYRKPGITERITKAATDGQLAISIVTRIEKLRGRFEAVMKASSTDELITAQSRLAETEEFLRRFTVLIFDAAAMLHFDRLRANKKLKKIGRGDLLIACIALASGATLVTRNTKDFANIPGLKLENWAE